MASDVAWKRWRDLPADTREIVAFFDILTCAGVPPELITIQWGRLPPSGEMVLGIQIVDFGLLAGAPSSWPGDLDQAVHQVRKAAHAWAALDTAQRRHASEEACPPEGVPVLLTALYKAVLLAALYKALPDLMPCGLFEYVGRSGDP